MSDEKGSRVAFRAPTSLKQHMEELARLTGRSPSELWRMAGEFALAQSADVLDLDGDERRLLELTAEIERRREQIKERAKPIDYFGGFPGRVANDFEARFKNGYHPKALAAKAGSYVEEAKMLEEKVPEHPHAPPIEEGELVDQVESEVRAVVDAASLSGWLDGSERYMKFSGVEDVHERRKFALALTESAMRMDLKLEPLRASTASERRVAGDDLPERAEDDLPDGLTRADVAEAACRLVDRGADPDDLPRDPTEFDPFGWSDMDVLGLRGDTGTAALVSADGGEDSLPTDDPRDVEDDESDDESDESDPLTELVEWAAENARRGRDVEHYLTLVENSDPNKSSDTNHETKQTMNRYNLTPNQVAQLANEYNDERGACLLGERDELPEVVAGQGGVRLE